MTLSAAQVYGIWLLQELRKASPERIGQDALAEMLGISSPYVDAIMKKLTKAGLARSTKGWHGGYELANPAHRVTLLEVVQAVPETIREVDAKKRFHQIRKHAGEATEEAMSKIYVDDL